MILSPQPETEIRGAPPQPRKVAVVVLAFLIASFGLRLFRLETQSIWWDEARNIEVAQLPLSQIAAHPGLDIHPPLYFYLLHFWIRAAGTTEFATRFFSVAFSLLWIAALYQLGRALAGVSLGVLVTFVATLAPLSIHEAQEARMYSLALGLATLSTYFLWSAWRTRRWQQLLGYLATAAAGLWVHYSMGLVIAFQNLWVLGSLIRTPPGQRWNALRAWLLAQVGVALLFTPQAPRALQQLMTYRNPNLSPPSHADFLAQIWRFYNTELSIDPQVALPGLLGIGLFLGLGSLLLFQRARRDPSTRAPLLLIALWIAVSLALYWLAVQERSYFHPRYTLLMAPAYFLLLAYVVAELARRWLPGGILAGVGMLAVFGVADHSYYFDARYFRDDLRGAAGYVSQVATEDDVVILDFPYGFGLYYRGSAPFHYLPGDLKETPVALNRLVRDKDHLYLVRSFRSDLDLGQVIPFLLGKYAELQGEVLYPGYAITEYDLSEAATFEIASNWQPASALFGEEITLIEYAFGGVDGNQVPSGGLAWAALRWRSRSPLSTDYKASALLYDAHMHLVGQADRPLLNPSRIYTSDWAPGQEGYSLHLLPVDPATPPGEYPLALALYKPDTLERLGVHTAAGDFLGATFPLGTLKVSRPLTPLDPASLSIRYPLQNRFGDIELLGHDLSLSSLHPGESFSLPLYWRALTEPNRDYGLAFLAQDEEGRRWELGRGPLLESFPTSQWAAGDVWRVWYDLRLDPDTALGSLELSLRLLDPARPNPVGEVSLAQVSIIPGRAHSFQRPSPQVPLDLSLGSAFKLLGYDISTSTLRPGERLSLTLYWRSVARSDLDYTVFTHLLDQNNRIWGQVDSPPLGGLAPTSSWLPGEVIADPYSIPLDPQSPPGAYWLEVGLYDPQTGQRLLFRDPSGGTLGDRFLVGPISVSEP